MFFLQVNGEQRSVDVLARGDYLTEAADCVACHTVAGLGQDYAGGAAFKLPFGTIYSSNITADPANGGSFVSYLRSVPALEGNQPIGVDSMPPPVLASTDSAPGSDDAANSQGRHVFEDACASFHHWDGQGQQTPYASLLGARSVNADTEVSALANYVIGHFGGKPGTATPAEVAKRRQF